MMMCLSAITHLPDTPEKSLHAKPHLSGYANAPPCMSGKQHSEE